MSAEFVGPWEILLASVEHEIGTVPDSVLMVIELSLRQARNDYPDVYAGDRRMVEALEGVKAEVTRRGLRARVDGTYAVSHTRVGEHVRRVRQAKHN